MLGFIFRLIDDDSHLQKQFKILFWYFEVLKRRQNPSFFFFYLFPDLFFNHLFLHSLLFLKYK